MKTLKLCLILTLLVAATCYGITFGNTSMIAINGNTTVPYPSTISVSAGAGPIKSVTATLHEVTHSYPWDMEALLVGPGGENVVLMASVSQTGISDVTLTFQDGAPLVPVSGVINSGTYSPTNYGLGDPFGAPAPAGPYGSTLSVFNGTNPNGDWNLYIWDQYSFADDGVIAGGWSLSFELEQPDITYQGRLLDGNIAADGLYDLQFMLYDNSDPVTGSQVGTVNTLEDTPVTNGYFVAGLSFGDSAFNGDERWLQIAVRPFDRIDPDDFVALSPLQPITHAPYALYARRTRGITVDDDLNVGIGTTTPAEALEVDGNAKVTGDLTVDGTINLDSIHVSQITGVLGTGFTLAFPEVIDNLATLEISGVAVTDPVVVINGPGYDTERIEGFTETGQHDDMPGLSMEHPFMFEAGGTDAVNIQFYFDTYLANPESEPRRPMSLIVQDLGGSESFRWNLYEFAPVSYEPAADGRTLFRLDHALLPDTQRGAELVPSNPLDNQLSYDPETEMLIEIAGVGTLYARVEENQAERTVTLTHDFVEGAFLQGWYYPVLDGFFTAKRSMSIVELVGGIEVSRRNYYGCFPMRYEHLSGFGLDMKLKIRVVISYDLAEDA